jgi:hypothetical protein
MPTSPHTRHVRQNTGRALRGAWLTLALSAVLVVSLLSGVASAGKTQPPSSLVSVTWTGGGSVVDGDTRSLKTVKCDASNTPYLSWVLSGSKATSASITIPGQSPQSMGKPQVDKQGWSTFKYTWSPGAAIDLNTLYNTVTASYNDAKNKAVLTIGQGCLGSGGGGGSTTTTTTSTTTTSSTTTTTTIPSVDVTIYDLYGGTFTVTYGETTSSPAGSWTGSVPEGTSITLQGTFTAFAAPPSGASCTDQNGEPNGYSTCTITGPGSATIYVANYNFGFD